MPVEVDKQAVKELATKLAGQVESQKSVVAGLETDTERLKAELPFALKRLPQISPSATTQAIDQASQELIDGVKQACEIGLQRSRQEGVDAVVIDGINQLIKPRLDALDELFLQEFRENSAKLISLIYPDDQEAAEEVHKTVYAAVEEEMSAYQDEMQKCLQNALDHWGDGNIFEEQITKLDILRRGCTHRIGAAVLKQVTKNIDTAEFAAALQSSNILKNLADVFVNLATPEIDQVNPNIIEKQFLGIKQQVDSGKPLRIENPLQILESIGLDQSDPAIKYGLEELYEKYGEKQAENIIASFEIDSAVSTDDKKTAGRVMLATLIARLAWIGVQPERRAFECLEIVRNEVSEASLKNRAVDSASALKAVSEKLYKIDPQHEKLYGSMGDLVGQYFEKGYNAYISKLQEDGREITDFDQQEAQKAGIVASIFVAYLDAVRTLPIVQR